MGLGFSRFEDPPTQPHPSVCGSVCRGHPDVGEVRPAPTALSPHSRPSVRCSVDPPHIEDAGRPAELSLPLGAPLELRCDAQGIPPPNVTWHKNGRALRSQEDGEGAGQLLRVEAVQVLLPRCLWRESGGGGAGRNPAAPGRSGRAPALCGVRTRADPPGPSPQGLPARSEPRLMPTPHNQRRAGAVRGNFLEEAGFAPARVRWR